MSLALPGVLRQRGGSSPSIVTGNMRIHLDAGNTASYPGTGSVWTDMVQGIQFSLVNNPTFNTGSGGFFNFVSAAQQHCYTSTNLPVLSTFTVEAWVLVGNLAGTTPAIYTNVFPDSTQELNAVLALGDGKATIGVYSNATGWTTTPGFTAPLNNWLHIVGTFDGAWMRLYVNGVLQTYIQATSVVPGGNTGGTYLMRRWDNPDFVGGRLAVLRVYSRGLTLAEVAQNYNAQCGRFGLSPAPTSPPMAVYDLRSYVSQSASLRDGVGGTAATVNLPTTNSFSLVITSG